jgi:hypothetical protein
MHLKTIRAKAQDQVEQLVDKVRAQAGVERILIVHDRQGSSIYVEGQPTRAPKPAARPS